MAVTLRTFRVFVSSTFEDLVEERDLLQRRVFPALTQFCRTRGAQFQAVDLRWGVSEQAGVDHRTIEICLAEIERCRTVSPRPNFIVFLGDRYGWCPPPSEIPVDAFERIAAQVASDVDRGLLEQWYGRDDNAVPPVRYLRPRLGPLRDQDAWVAVERRLRAILQDAVAGTEWADDPRFVGSATEQEIVAGVMSVADAGEHVFCFMRSPSTDDDRLSRLKDRLRALLPNGVYEYQTSRRGGHLESAYLDRLADDVTGALTRVIAAQLDTLDDQDPLVEDIARHREFGAERAADFTGREWALARIAVQLERGGVGQHPLVVCGASGAGKSALMARAAIEAEREHPDAVTVSRFLGCTPSSTNGRDLLDGLCRQVVRAYGSTPELVGQDRAGLLDERTLPSGYDDLVAEFRNRLALASSARPLHVFLDALDQLSATDPAHRLGWLPNQLPEHVRVVVSTTDSSAACGILRARLPAEQIAELDRMEQVEGEHLLHTWLARAGRTLTPAQRALVIERFELEGLPLYLKLAFEQARRWRSDEPGQLAIGIRGVIRTNLFARLAAEDEHGAMLVARSLGYLGAARNGLSEDEVLDLLSADRDVLADFRRRSPRSPVVNRLPPIVWSRLYFDLEPYLSERVADGARLLTFYHRQLREVIDEDYLSGEDGARSHRQLAGYFSDDAVQPLALGAATNLRRLSEMPYQLTEAGLWDALTATLTDFAFLDAKANVGVYQLQDDYGRALTRMPDPDGVVDAFNDALEREAHNLVAEPTLLFQQLYNRLQWSTGSARDVVERERGRRTTPFMHTINRVRESTALRRTLAADSNYVSKVVAIPGSGLVVSSGFDPALKIWDPRTGELLSVLAGHTASVETCEPTPDGRRLVSVSRDETIRIWDLATGMTLHTLAGHNENYVGAFACAVSSDSRFAVVAAKAGSGAFNVWDLDSGAMIVSFSGHRWHCSSWAIAPGSAIVATGYSDGRLLTWNPLDGQIVAAAVADGDHLVQLAFGTDGETVVTATGPGPGSTAPVHRVQCWDSRTLEQRWDRAGHSFVIGAEGTVYVGHGDDNTVDVIDRRGEPVTTFQCPLAWGYNPQSQLSPDGTLIVTTGSVGEPTVWETRSGQRVGDLIGHGGQIQHMVFTDKGFIATACDDGTVRIWNPSELRPDDELSGHAGPVNSTRISPDGTAVVSAGQTNVAQPQSTSVKIWSVRDASLVRAIDAHAGEWAYHALFIPGRNDLVTAGLHDVAFWSGDDGRLVGRWQGQVGLNAVHADGHWVLGTNWTEGMSVLDPARADAIAMVPTESQVVRVALTPDGHVAFGGRRDGVVQAWNIADWSFRWSEAAHADDNVHGMLRSSPIHAVAVSPDSRYGLSAGADRTIRVWELATGDHVRTLEHPASVEACAYTPDGAAIVASAGDGSIWVWDTDRLTTGRPLGHAGSPGRHCVVTPDGRYVITTHHDSSITMRELATGALAASIRLTGIAMCFDLHPWRPFLVCGDQAGTVSLVEILQLEYGPIVVSAHEHRDGGLSVRCPRCRAEHRIGGADLGRERRCSTSGCALPLRLNAFYSSSAPPSLAAWAPTPGATTLTRWALDAIVTFLIGSAWHPGPGYTWRFYSDGTVTFSDEPTVGSWTLQGYDARVIRAGDEIVVRVGLNHDVLGGVVRRRGDVNGTWNQFTLDRGPL